jgi:hypothetical protein
MDIAALITWIIAIGGGLFLLSIWLIEYDREFQSVAATRLPVLLISAHALLAVSAFVLWVGYLITNQDRLAKTAAIVLAAAVALGVTMGVRWIGVYRRYRSVPRGRGRFAAASQQPSIPIPPERHFPLAVVVGHGVFAGVTIVLVVLTITGAGGS